MGRRWVGVEVTELKHVGYRITRPVRCTSVSAKQVASSKQASSSSLHPPKNETSRWGYTAPWKILGTPNNHLMGPLSPQSACFPPANGLCRPGGCRFGMGRIQARKGPRTAENNRKRCPVRARARRTKSQFRGHLFPVPTPRLLVSTTQNGSNAPLDVVFCPLGARLSAFWGVLGRVYTQ